MNTKSQKAPVIVIACGGSGGHFYPGLAVANRLSSVGCDIILIVTEKEVDRVMTASLTLQPGQHPAAVGSSGIQVVRLPAVGLVRGKVLKFVANFLKSYFKSKKLFARVHPRAVLGMGGFSSAPPVLAAPVSGCKVFLHEGNSVAGRANRLISPFVNTAFVYFPQAASRLHAGKIKVTGMPVRDVFVPVDAVAAKGRRMALEMEPDKPVLLVMGGSQGASAINRMMIENAKQIHHQIPELQVIHLTGKNDFEAVKAKYEKLAISAWVYEYFTEMELVMEAATVAVSRSGASSLAEIAAVGLPSVLIPFPSAADNHQYYNAQAFVESGAAVMLEQKKLGDGIFANTLVSLLKDQLRQNTMKEALAQWSKSDASITIAKAIAEIALNKEELNTDWNFEPLM